MPRSTFITSLNDKEFLEELEEYCNNARNFVESDPPLSAIYARKAVEFLIKHIYKKIGAKIPDNVSLCELIDNEIIKDFLGQNIIFRLNNILIIGAIAMRDEYKREITITVSLRIVKELRSCERDILHIRCLIERHKMLQYLRNLRRPKLSKSIRQYCD